MKYQFKHFLQIFWHLSAKLFAIKLKVIPQKGLKNLAENNWQALNSNSQFILKKHRFNPFKKFPKGWYLLQVQINHQFQNSQLAKLYIKDAQLNESVIPLPLRPFRNTNRFIYIDKPTSHLRFDPLETEGEFTLQTIRLVKVPAKFALNRQLQRVCNLIPELHNLNRKMCREAIKLHAKKEKISFTHKIISLYGETFPGFKAEKSYQDWIKHHETQLITKYRNLHRNIETQSKISILVPTYNPDPEHFEECIKSVIQQSYSNWQLCIVDNASTKKKHLNYLKKVSESDNRIHFIERQDNGHISKVSNDALDLANGEYTLLLDHDDLLPKHCLEMFAIAIQQHPECKIFYGDEDKVDERNQRFMPHFKPDWNPDLLYSQNYIGHPVVFKTEKLKDIGGFRLEVEDCHDYDLLLRYTKDLSVNQIMHIPWILYHWRTTANQTAQNTDSKSYTEKAGIKALDDFFQSQEMSVQVSSGMQANTYRCQFLLPNKPPLVSLIIPTHNGFEILKNCVDSILEKTTYKNYEIIIVNNNSNCSKTLAYFKQLDHNHKNIRILDWSHPFNYSAINNFAVKHAYGEVIGLINNDIEVITPEWLEEMLSHAIRPEIGCVGAKLYYPNDTVQHAGIILGIGGVAGHSHKYFGKQASGYFKRLQLTQNLSAVTGACLLVRKSIFDEVGGLDSENLAASYNDVDFCLKVRELGYRNLFTPWAELYHHESVTRGKFDSAHKKKLHVKESSFMKQKWRNIIHHDPAYNRNLSLSDESFSL